MGKGHDVTGGTGIMVRGSSAVCPVGQTLKASPGAMAPTAQPSPGMSLVALIYIGMWLGTKAASGQVLLLQMSSVVKK